MNDKLHAVCRDVKDQFRKWEFAQVRGPCLVDPYKEPTPLKPVDSRGILPIGRVRVGKRLNEEYRAILDAKPGETVWLYGRPIVADDSLAPDGYVVEQGREDPNRIPWVPAVLL